MSSLCSKSISCILSLFFVLFYMYAMFQCQNYLKQKLEHKAECLRRVNVKEEKSVKFGRVISKLS